MMKKLIALVLALVLCFTMFVGCSGDGSSDEDRNSDVAVIDFAAAFAKYDPETVVMAINGEDVSWSEFYYMLSYEVDQLQYYMGDIVWDEMIGNGYDYTYEEYVMLATMDSLKQFHSVSRKAAELNISLNDEELTLLQDMEDSFKQENCGEEASDEDFNTYLLENYYLTADVYRFIIESSLLYDKLFAETVGKSGEKLSDDEVNAYIESVPYITAKHILIRSIDDSYNALSEEEITAAEEKANTLLNQLKNISDQKKLEETFDELMNQYSEDEGLILFPDGYTFTTGEMLEEFEAAAFALDEYELSEVVKSDVGYHILLRLPTTRNSLVDYTYESNSAYTIASYAATDAYNKLMTAWVEETEIVWEEAFAGMTAEEIFA